jgi:hypothetical protein
VFVAEDKDVLMVEIRHVCGGVSVREYPLVWLVKDGDALEGVTDALTGGGEVSVKHVIATLVAEVTDDYAEISIVLQYPRTFLKHPGQLGDEGMVVADVAKISLVIAVPGRETLGFALLGHLVVLLVEDVPIGWAGQNKVNGLVRKRRKDVTNVTLEKLLVEEGKEGGAKLIGQPPPGKLGEDRAEFDSNTVAPFNRSGFER